MKKTFICSVVLLCLIAKVSAQLTVDHLLTENRENPIGLDIHKPRFSWQIISNNRNTIQKAYEIELYQGNNYIWRSGKKESDRSVHVPYEGTSLTSNKKYYWKVKVWDSKGKASEWSKPAYFTTALFDISDWKAKWIIPAFKEDSINRPSPIFRKEFNIVKTIQSATAFISSHGLYEAHINGKRVGDAFLTPGWTSYNKRIQYQVYDVTDHIKKGRNAIGVTLGNGWYRGIIGFTNSINVYGKDIALIFQLNINYSDGSSEVITSDNSWKSSTGEIRYSEIYNGEWIDTRKNKEGWLLAGYNDKDWDAVTEANFPINTLIATYNEPVRKHEVFKPIGIFKTPEGDQVIDFGQNLVGWVVMKVKGAIGDSITISHAEVLDKKGNFYTANLREAKATNRYVLNDDKEHIFQPHFTWQGFRYARIEGYPGELKADNFEAVTLYSDIEQTGSFTTSDPMINQLQHNIQWGQKGNFLDVPTDCPQRDERLGWTGDAQAFSRTAAFNRNVDNFFAKWLKDLAADQQNGVVPFVIPNVLGGAINSAGWADVATIIPWNMYIAYDDKKILEDQYTSMKSYVESIRRTAKNDLWNTGFHFGDWLFYRPADDNDGRSAVTDKYLIAQCFYAHSVQLLINASKVLNKEEDAKEYNSLLQRIKDAYLNEYVTSNGRLVSGTQTAYVLALNFDMLPERLRQQAAARLADNIRSYGNHLTTGFLGTPYLCHVLTRFGYTDVAFKLLMQDTYPSWLYPVKMGATTIWERWDGIKPDSTFQTPSMNSYNHYAYGAIGDWMYSEVAGLDTYEDGPGYKHIMIKPHVGGGLSNVSVTLKTYYGMISSGWKIENDKFNLDVEIPANTSATIFIPADNADAITESGLPLSGVKDIKNAGKEDNYMILQLGSGNYHFSTSMNKNIISQKSTN